MSESIWGHTTRSNQVYWGGNNAIYPTWESCENSERSRGREKPGDGTTKEKRRGVSRKKRRVRTQKHRETQRNKKSGKLHPLRLRLTLMLQESESHISIGCSHSKCDKHSFGFCHHFFHRDIGLLSWRWLRHLLWCWLRCWLGLWLRRRLRLRLSGLAVGISEKVQPCL